MSHMPWLSNFNVGLGYSARNELEKYLETNFDAFILNALDYNSDFYKFDPLGFWKENSRSFSIVIRMASDLLTVFFPAVASE